MAEGEKTLVAGSRSSQLAMIQTNTIIERLKELNPGVKISVKTMKTIGDQVLDKPLPNIGQTNLFTKELETALAAGQVDFIVHSLKDLPTTLPPGMHLAVIYKRDSPTDSLVLSSRHSGETLGTLARGSVIGTSSLRRIAQLTRVYPALRYASVRGNLNTRLSKLDNGGYDGLILATAGIHRMGWSDRISQELDPSVCMYAVGQGALAIETRLDDRKTLEIVESLNDPDTVLSCSAERQFLKFLGGGCSVPVGVASIISEDKVYTLQGAVFSLDGSQMVKGEVSGNFPAEYPCVSACRAFGEEIGQALAEDLIVKGAKRILEQAREETDKVTTDLAEKDTVA